MHIPKRVKRGIKKIVAAMGYQISRVEAKPPTPPQPTPGSDVPTGLERSTMSAAIQSLARRLPSLATVIDIGASSGCWTDLALREFPRSQYLLIEAQPVHVPALDQFCAAHPNVSYVPAAAGASAGQIYFYADAPFSGQAGYKPYPANNLVVPVTTIDEEVRARKLAGPFLLKLDTHGFEVPILEGASVTLAQTEAIVIECYNFKISPECLRFHEMCSWLEERGFRCIDLVDVMRRPNIDALWQMDLVFMRTDRPEFKKRPAN